MPTSDTLLLQSDPPPVTPAHAHAVSLPYAIAELLVSFGLSPNFGLSERLSKSLSPKFDKVKS